MFIKLLISLLLGYVVGYLQVNQMLKKKKRECLNKRQMIENRDILIGNLEEKIKKLEHDSFIYNQIKQIYKTEKKFVDRHDKTKELIDKDSTNSMQ